MHRPPISTYRVQLTPELGFDRVGALAGYLARLGVSHLYASPYLQAAPGSRHGYDVVDPARANAELGGEAGRRRMVERLRGAGLGQVLDIVPNHMAIAGRTNRWWWDVLENGSMSRHARYFDVSWDSPDSRLRGVVLVPVLADHYGRVLARGELRLEWDAGAGEMIVRHPGGELPVAPRSLDSLLEAAASGELRALAGECAAIPDVDAGDREAVAARHARKEEVKRELRQLAGRADVRAERVRIARDVSAQPDRLDRLLERQSYRLARWRVAGQELDYRRFFDINELVALRMEDPEVFEAVHALTLEWVVSGEVDGLRVDHVDGLRDPEQYLLRLRERAPETWIVAEKILHAEERLPETWPVAGTTGYDFMNTLLRLFVAPSGREPMDALYRELTGLEEAWEDVAHEAKLLVLAGSLAADLNRLTDAFVRVCEKNRAFRDFTREEIHDALRELLACLRVYRTYVRPGIGQVTEEDRRWTDDAAREARRRRPDIDAELIDFITGVVLLEYTGGEESEFLMRLQQTSGPVAAKGVEDTALYRHNAMVCLNEVGGDPGAWSISPESFHETCDATLRRRPAGMTSTSTHDTKRSEDVRARLALLSEIPEAWAAAVRRWSRANERHRRGGLPDRNLEYLLYQTLVGAHPLSRERARAYMEKASKEAKTRTSWTHPDAEYDAALRGFVEGAMSDEGFLAELDAFVRPLLAPGWMTSLAMKLIALTAPGVPDVYQGTELWDLSLVDPDNRREVDFELRMRMLHELDALPVAEVWRRAEEGLPKLLVTHRALRLRGRLPEVFATGAHQPLRASGEKAEHLVAFARGGRALTLVPRLVMGLRDGGAGDGAGPVDRRDGGTRDGAGPAMARGGGGAGGDPGGCWGDTRVELPAGRWRDELSGRELSGGEVRVGDVLRDFPVALLSR
jgi:(1->4)-alpha-D-glucan 1-alpha-D-glucosylmutase